MNSIVPVRPGLKMASFTFTFKSKEVEQQLGPGCCGQPVCRSVRDFSGVNFAQTFDDLKHQCNEWVWLMRDKASQLKPVVTEMSWEHIEVECQGHVGRLTRDFEAQLQTDDGFDQAVTAFALLIVNSPASFKRQDVSTTAHDETFGHYTVDLCSTIIGNGIERMAVKSDEGLPHFWGVTALNCMQSMQSARHGGLTRLSDDVSAVIRGCVEGMLSKYAAVEVEEEAKGEPTLSIPVRIVARTVDASQIQNELAVRKCVIEHQLGSVKNLDVDLKYDDEHQLGVHHCGDCTLLEEFPKTELKSQDIFDATAKSLSLILLATGDVQIEEPTEAERREMRATAANAACSVLRVRKSALLDTLIVKFDDKGDTAGHWVAEMERLIVCMVHHGTFDHCALGDVVLQTARDAAQYRHVTWTVRFEREEEGYAFDVKKGLATLSSRQPTVNVEWVQIALRTPEDDVHIGEPLLHIAVLAADPDTVDMDLEAGDLVVKFDLLRLAVALHSVWFDLKLTVDIVKNMFNKLTAKWPTIEQLYKAVNAALE